MKRAEEIMIPLEQYPHVAQWLTLRQAIALMETFQIDVEGRKSLPRVVLVLDESDQLLGVARRRDIMRGLEPRFMASEPLQYRKKLFDVRMDPDLAVLSDGGVIDAIRVQAERPVSDVMKPISTTVDCEDPLLVLVSELVTNDLSLVPVMKNQKVVGVVRTVDVFHELAKIVV